MAERTRLEPMLGFILIQTFLLYPVIMSWTWSPYGGFLRDLGFFDRGGSIVIFYTGALAGIVGSVVVGPRYGKFMSKKDREKITTGGKEVKKKTLPGMLEDV